MSTFLERPWGSPCRSLAGLLTARVLWKQSALTGAAHRACSEVLLRGAVLLEARKVRAKHTACVELKGKQPVDPSSPLSPPCFWLVIAAAPVTHPFCMCFPPTPCQATQAGHWAAAWFTASAYLEVSPPLHLSL